VANFWREDVHQYTVLQRVFETVLRCLNEPLPVASPAQAEWESTKKILKTTDIAREIAAQKERGWKLKRKER
jgi:hypothetical protein